MSSLIQKETSWYERIELPIRPFVKLLRDNGFNTSCSCGHEMRVEIEDANDEDVSRLGELLIVNDYRNWEINYRVYNRPDCYWHRSMELHIIK